jgi:Flp pilus assembly pilin Flp
MLFFSDEEGQALAEYAFILVSIAVLVLILVMLFGERVLALYSTIVSAVVQAVSG